MVDFTIGEVPEHFNYPWYLTLKTKKYQKHVINLRWIDYPGGTGDMCKSLRTGKTDIAVVLTEGIIKDIIEENPSKNNSNICQYSLKRGIHVSATSIFTKISELKDKRIAISKFDSGSHLMAIVNAYNQGWNINTLKFIVVKNLEGGINAIQNNEVDYFLWEHFTTKPIIEKNVFRRFGNCPFSMALFCHCS